MASANLSFGTCTARKSQPKIPVPSDHAGEPHVLDLGEYLLQP